MRKISFFSFLLATIVLLQACGEKNYVPKPKGFNRIEIPAPSYGPSMDALPYKFKLSNLAVQTEDTSRLAEKFWTNIIYKEFDATIQLTYKPIQNDEALLTDYLSDAYKLTSRHQQKAYSIEENVVKSPNGHTAVIQELSGEVPTQFQFFITDSTDHFLRAALYFKTATANDSLAPIISYIKTDMMHMINTFSWTDQALGNYDNQLDKLRKLNQ